jgi:hypothetical protein
LRSLKAAAFEAAFPEAAARTARARIIPPELFDQFLVAANDPRAAFDLRLAVESPSGVCSSAQKLKSRFFVRMATSCCARVALVWHRNKK